MKSVEACWKEDESPDLDPRVKWELRWNKIRVILKKEKVRIVEKKKECGDLAESLHDLCTELANSKDPKVALALAILETKIRA